MNRRGKSLASSLLVHKCDDAGRPRVSYIEGNRDHPINKGVLCVKGRFGSFEYVSHEERLTAPLIRKDGELVEATWDEALDRIAKKFGESKGEKFASLASARITNEDNYLIQKFTKQRSYLRFARMRLCGHIV